MAAAKKDTAPENPDEVQPDDQETQQGGGDEPPAADIPDQNDGEHDETPEAEETHSSLIPRTIGELRVKNIQADTEVGKQVRRYNDIASALKPGQVGYNPHHDPLVPSSTVADTIAVELVASEGQHSATWEGLRERADAERARFEARLSAEDLLHN